MNSIKMLFISFACYMLLVSCTPQYFIKKDKSEIIDSIRVTLNTRPTNCQNAISQFYLLTRLKLELYSYEFDTSLVSFYKSFNPMVKLTDAIAIDSTFIDAYRILGDIEANRLESNDSAKEASLKWYYKGLHFDPSNNELNLRVGYIYDLFDNKDSAFLYYNKITSPIIPLTLIHHKEKININVSIILNNLIYSDSLARFFSRDTNNFILFERIPTYSWINASRAYCKIWANKKLEFFDYFGDIKSPFLYKSTVTDTQLTEFISCLQQIRFLSLYNLFSVNINDKFPMADFSRVEQWHLPNYKITFHADEISHDLIVYGLNAISGENALRDVPSISYKADLNIPSNSYIGMKLSRLSDLWCKAFSSKIITNKIFKLYGEVIYPLYGNPNYLFKKTDNMFIKIKLPSFEILWETPAMIKVKHKVHRLREHLFPDHLLI